MTSARHEQDLERAGNNRQLQTALITNALTHHYSRRTLERNKCPILKYNKHDGPKFNIPHNILYTGKYLSQVFFSYLLPLPSAEDFFIFNDYEQKQTIRGVL